MNEAEIRKYAGLMKELGLTGLAFTEGERGVRLERSAPLPAGEAVYSVPVAEQAPSPAAPQDGSSVRSPIVGVFYAAPAENAAPYVTIGDAVKKGQTLCIIDVSRP